jgi:hypothetical protein
MEEDVILVCVNHYALYDGMEQYVDYIRPKEFVKKPAYEDSDDEESTVGKMPPTDSDEE